VVLRRGAKGFFFGTASWSVRDSCEQSERSRHVFGMTVREDLVEKGDSIRPGDEWIEL
jgi:hypothetical protein